ncbi:glutamyl-tRNA amidotransferase subunit A [Xylaria digitata]|nr:glutamyl-tRNA amidotransferase subunit A [Xylaria digitata]
MAALVKLTPPLEREVTSPIPSLLGISLDGISIGFDVGIFTATDVVCAYLKRIEEVNHLFESVLEINKDAVRIARELDEEAKKSGRRGAIILGNASLTEWANYGWNNAATGWCPRGMKTSGSSTGSVVSTSLGLAFAAIGTETNGSICNPARKGNLVGLKPTTGLVSRDGIIPASYRFDTTRPFTQNVKDAATILRIIAGKTCQKSDLSGIRIDIPRHCIQVIQQDEAATFANAVKTLDILGAEISLKDTMSVTIADLADSLGDYSKSLETIPQSIDSLQELIEYTKATAEERYPTYNKYKKLGDLFESIRTDGGSQGALDREKLDVLIVPIATSIPVTFASLAGSPLIAVPLGFYGPDTPVAKDSKGDLIALAPGIPFPICFFTRRFEEELLLKVAHAFEQLFSKGPNTHTGKSPLTDFKDVVKTPCTGVISVLVV